MKNETEKNPQEYYKHLSVFWNDLIYLMSSKPQALTSVGPMRSFGTNAKKIADELIESSEDLAEFNKKLMEYYQQLSDTWAEAQKKVNVKMPKIPKDPEQFDSYAGAYHGCNEALYHNAPGAWIKVGESGGRDQHES